MTDRQGNELISLMQEQNRCLSAILEKLSDIDGSTNTNPMNQDIFVEKMDKINVLLQHIDDNTRKE